MKETKNIVKTDRAFFIILMLIICIIFLLIFINTNMSDGIGFARGKADAQMYFGLAKRDIRNGELILSIYWMLLGSRVAIDSEIKWNKAQSYVNHFNLLIDEGQFKEALSLCPEIDQLIKKYDWDGEMLTDCGRLRESLTQNEP